MELTGGNATYTHVCLIRDYKAEWHFYSSTNVRFCFVDFDDGAAAHRQMS